MNNFTKRIVFGLLYVGLVISSSLLGAVFFYSLFLVFMMICIYEFIKIIELKSIYPYLLGATCFFTAVISNNNLVVFEDNLSEKITLSIFLTSVYFSFGTCVFKKNWKAIFREKFPNPTLYRCSVLSFDKNSLLEFSRNF